MLCFDNNIAISHVYLLLVLGRQELAIEQWKFLDLSKIFYIWNTVILIHHLAYVIIRLIIYNVNMTHMLNMLKHS